MKPNTKIYSLQIIRYYAASIVFFYHASKKFDGIFLLDFFDFGYAGVDIFFVLSGFVISLSQYNKSNNFNILKFLKNRSFRIYPSFWIFLFFPLLFVAIFFPSLSPAVDPFKSWEIVLAFLLIFGHPVISQVTWTLSYELYFYFFYGIIKKLKKMHLIKIYAALIIINKFIYNFTDVFFIDKYLLNTIILEFFMGVLSFHIFKSFYLNKKQVTSILIIGILLFIVFSLNFFNFNGAIIREYRFLTFGFPSFLIITSFSILERLGVFNLGNGLLSKLGDASYVMYLIHSPIVSFCSIIMPISLYNIGMVFLFLIVSFLSLFLYFFIDYPIYKKLKNL